MQFSCPTPCIGLTSLRSLTVYVFSFSHLKCLPVQLVESWIPLLFQYRAAKPMSRSLHPKLSERRCGIYTFYASLCTRVLLSKTIKKFHRCADWQIKDNPMGLRLPPCSAFATWYGVILLLHNLLLALPPAVTPSSVQMQQTCKPGVSSV